ncbi:hypothetical protein LINGRAHAP2_LOCUS6495, partial [Linum grandiflorum]
MKRTKRTERIKTDGDWMSGVLQVGLKGCYTSTVDLYPLRSLSVDSWWHTDTKCCSFDGCS